jgi:membrane fusion protein, multidrug efflux system
LHWIQNCRRKICQSVYKKFIGQPAILFLLITATVFISCKAKDTKADAKPAAKPPVKVDVFVVQPKNISEQIELPGSLAPFEETAVQTEVPGRVVRIGFAEGAAVAKGSLLIKLDDADLQAQLKKIQVQLAIAKKTEERQNELLKINGISQQDYDLSLLNVNNLQADINILKTSIDKTAIRAPFSGRAGLRNISMGAYITSQTVITTIRETGRLKLIFTVPERYGTAIHSGSQIHFTIDGGKQPYPAQVIATENNIEEATRSLKVKASVIMQAPELIAGSFAKVLLKLRDNSMVLMIPTQSIIPQAKSKKVMAVRNGLASLETVTTGLRDSSMVEITSGLKTGDTVLTTGLMNVKPGSAVNSKTKTPPNL